MQDISALSNALYSFAALVEFLYVVFLYRVPSLPKGFLFTFVWFIKDFKGAHDLKQCTCVDLYS